MYSTFQCIIRGFSKPSFMYSQCGCTIVANDLTENDFSPKGPSRTNIRYLKYTLRIMTLS